MVIADPEALPQGRGPQPSISAGVEDFLHCAPLALTLEPVFDW